MMIPENPSVAPNALALRLLEAAQRLLRDRRPEDALPMLERLVRLPTHARAALPLQAEALLNLGRLEPAEAAATTALAEAPADGALLRLRAQIRLARGDHHGAIDDAATAVMTEPEDPAGKALLGGGLLEVQRFAEAIWFLGEALRGRPEDPFIMAALGRAFMLGGYHEAAAELLAHCAAVAPQLSGLAGLRAQALLLAGDAAGAEAMARAALAAGQIEAGLYSVVGHALVSQYRIDEAGPLFAAAARLAPEDRYLAELAAATQAAPAAAGPAPAPAPPPASGIAAALFALAVNPAAHAVAHPGAHVAARSAAAARP
jgi:predicted Zn-dependent protease